MVGLAPLDPPLFACVWSCVSICLFACLSVNTYICIYLFVFWSLNMFFRLACCLWWLGYLPLSACVRACVRVCGSKCVCARVCVCLRARVCVRVHVRVRVSLRFSSSAPLFSTSRSSFLFLFFSFHQLQQQFVCAPILPDSAAWTIDPLNASRAIPLTSLCSLNQWNNDPPNTTRAIPSSSRCSLNEWGNESTTF